MTGSYSQHLSKLTARLQARNSNYTSRNSFPQKEVGFIVDDKNTLKSLEERVSRLTAGMESIQKTLDRFVTLYESEKSQNLKEREELEKLKKDVVASKNREMQLEVTIVRMRLQMDTLTSNCTQEKLQWEQERDQLQKELQHYKSLSQKGPTNSSSTETKELFNDSLKSQCVTEAKQEQSEGWKRNPHYTCDTVKTQFTQRTNYDRPVAWRRLVVAPKMKENRAEHVSQAGLPIKKFIIREYVESQQSQKNAGPKESHEHTSEQKLQEPVVTQDDRVIELTSIPSQAAPESKTAITNPPTHPTVCHSKPNAQQQLLVSLLEKHDCKNSECSIVAFRNYIRHATECAIGSQCTWFICNRMHARTEHLKVCNDKLQCTLCQQGSNVTKEGKIREIVMLLLNTCFPNCMNSCPKNASTRKAITDLAVRVAVNYGLIGNSDNTVNAETVQLQDMTVGESSSSSSFESSSDEEDISDKEESSEGEKTPEGWEII